MRAQEGYYISCPTCFEENVLLLDATEGAEQDFVVDCEVCCRAMQITVKQVHSGHPEIVVARAYD